MPLTDEQTAEIASLRTYRAALKAVQTKLTEQGGVISASVTDPAGTTQTYSRLDLARLRREIGHVNREINVIKALGNDCDPIFGRATRVVLR